MKPVAMLMSLLLAGCGSGVDGIAVPPPMDMAAIWADASVWVPWTLYTAYGDDAVLREQWPSMLAHVDRVVDLASLQGGSAVAPTAPLSVSAPIASAPSSSAVGARP